MSNPQPPFGAPPEHPWGPTPSGPQPAPPKKPRSLLDVVFLAAMGVLGLLATLGIVGWLVMAATGHADTAANAPQATAAAPGPPRRLEGLAGYKLRLGFQICGRQQLHACSVRWGFENMGHGTLQFDRTDIAPAVSCDTQVREAFARCSDAGDLLGSESQRATTARCLAPFGVFMRGAGTMREVDPRDPQEDPGTLRMDCAEGFREFRFEDQL